MRAASILLVAILPACAQVDANRVDSSAQLSPRLNGPSAPPAHYLTCGLPISESKLHCFEKAAATCPGGFTVSGPYPDLPHLVYACD
jgi:hypothetical protein